MVRWFESAQLYLPTTLNKQNNPSYCPFYSLANGLGFGSTGHGAIFDSNLVMDSKIGSKPKPYYQLEQDIGSRPKRDYQLEQDMGTNLNFFLRSNTPAE